ncbi:hypothetical protein QBC35DRAFT_482043 [Podospora australis]|uniref:Uncharacterized protein n=1 Tax=Podospora australis TaxID=1536484 RepID=A0AAN6X2M9_9PEZI|nr:hypothetical protein QBC35DRAFT_482043 [Podospora australis]
MAPVSEIEPFSRQLSIPLPHSLDNRIYLSLTVKSKAVLLFITTAPPDESSTATPLGSFVYALPDRFNTTNPLSTPLCTVEATLEFTTRLAKLLVRKTQLPVYVGNSVSFASCGMGGGVEEEMDALKGTVGVVTAELEKHRTGATTDGNGVLSDGVEGLNISS